MKGPYFAGTRERLSPVNMSNVILNPAKKAKRNNDNRVRTSAVQEVRVAKLFVAILVN
jgi:hypothetical protein